MISNSEDPHRRQHIDNHPQEIATNLESSETASTPPHRQDQLESSTEIEAGYRSGVRPAISHHHGWPKVISSSVATQIISSDRTQFGCRLSSISPTATAPIYLLSGKSIRGRIQDEASTVAPVKIAGRSPGCNHEGNPGENRPLLSTTLVALALTHHHPSNALEISHRSNYCLVDEVIVVRSPDLISPPTIASSIHRSWVELPHRVHREQPRSNRSRIGTTSPQHDTSDNR